MVPLDGIYFDRIRCAWRAAQAAQQGSALDMDQMVKKRPAQSCSDLAPEGIPLPPSSAPSLESQKPGHLDELRRTPFRMLSVEQAISDCRNFPKDSSVRLSKDQDSLGSSQSLKEKKPFESNGISRGPLEEPTTATTTPSRDSNPVPDFMQWGVKEVALPWVLLTFSNSTPEGSREPGDAVGEEEHQVVAGLVEESESG